MSDLTDMMAADAQQMFRAPSADDLLTISDLANKQLRLIDAIAEQEEILCGLKDQLSRVRDFELPQAIEATGLKEFELTNGSKVSIKEEIYAAITEENREAAFGWLEKTSNDGIIKNQINCPFGKGQDEDAQQLMLMLAEKGFSFTNSRMVHPQTLRAFIKKELEDGGQIPLEVFSVHIKKVATIKQSKEARKNGN